MSPGENCDPRPIRMKEEALYAEPYYLVLCGVVWCSKSAFTETNAPCA